MFRSLVWKEWHEQRWRLWFGVALLATFTAIGLRTRIMPDEQIAAFTIIVGGMFFPLMVAMGLIAPERHEGTIVRLLALPVPAWKVLAAKAVIGAAVCAAPMVASALIALAVAGNRELSWGELVGIYGMAITVAIMMFSWMTAAAARQPSEARAGLAGVGVVVAWCLLMALGSTVRTETTSEARFVEWIATFSPFGIVALKGGPIPAAGVIAIQGCSLVLLWLWSARRIAKPGKVVA
jgi:ABC-type transport system involved in multi-copper enzyme maturation permease subunit